ncbi:MAG TPA: aldehyde dehydrogenase family protein, partial [Chloroflexota bacterium]
MVLKSINPTTEDVVETFEEFSDTAVDDALQQAHDAQRAWRRTSFGERAARLQAMARVLRAQKQRLAALATREMGKTIVEAEAEIEKCAWNCDYYAEHAAAFLADEHVPTNAADSYVAFQPLGVVLAIMPWNFPFWQVFRFAAPALMAGNVGLLKHASNVPQCALEIEAILGRAGFPAGAFQMLLIGSGQVARVLDDPRVKAATL